MRPEEVIACAVIAFGLVVTVCLILAMACEHYGRRVEEDED